METKEYPSKHHARCAKASPAHALSVPKEHASQIACSAVHAFPAANDVTKGVAVCLDWDNLVARTNGRARMNWGGLATALREAGVVAGTCFANRMSSADKAYWRAIGLYGVSVNANVDEWVAASARWYAQRYAKLIIASGDHYYLDVVKAAAAAGVEVEIWGKRDAMSFQLLRAADGFRVIDRLLEETLDRTPTPAHSPHVRIAA